jgi:hypothetical protein
MDTVMRSYLEHLHPYISKGCSALFNNEHYPQASEEAAKAVFQILKPVNRARVFLIPSADAPVEYTDPQWWKDNQPLLDEKKKIVAAFASQNLSCPIRGVVFLHKFKKGGSAQTAYSSAFDQFLHTGRKANSKSA